MTHSRVQTFFGGLMSLAVCAAIFAPAFVFAVPTAHAQTLTEDELFGGSTGNEFANTAGLGTGDLTTTIAAILRAILGFLGIVAVGIILLGGFKWMTAGGAEDKVKDAKKYMVQGVIGLIIVLAAYAIASFVISSVTTAISNAENTEE